MLYFDNAASSGPKPETVGRAMLDALSCAYGNPGRAGHRISLKAEKTVEETRIAIAGLLNAERADHIIFGLNATDMLNLAIKGTVCPGDHVITTSMEHNSVSRPLQYLKGSGIKVTKLPSDINTGISIKDLEKAVRADTRLVVVNHVSNVTGTVNDISSIGSFCRENGITFLVDGAQSVGAFPIDVQEMKIDLLAFPGHKALLGPQGTGVLYVRPGVDIRPVRQGGTGSRSEQLIQPASFPDGYESGTLNVPGIAGLGAGVRFIMQAGTDSIHDAGSRLALRLYNGLSQLPNVRVYAPEPAYDRGCLLSFTIDKMDVQETAVLLDEAFDIAVRSGLHCAPDAHASIGTLSAGGTVRVSPGHDCSYEDVDTFIRAVSEIAENVHYS